MEFNLSIEHQNTDTGSCVFLASGQDPSLNPSHMRESPGTGRAKTRSPLEGLAPGGGQSVLRDTAALGSLEVSLRSQGKGSSLKLPEPDCGEHGDAGL